MQTTLPHRGIGCVLKIKCYLDIIETIDDNC